MPSALQLGLSASLVKSPPAEISERDREQLVAEAAALYAETIKAATGQVVKPKVKVNADPKKMLPDHKCCGGVMLTACHGRIVCDNTLDARVALVYDELLPTIREQLWDAAKK